MKVVVDANVVISAAITAGRTRKVIFLSDATFLAPPELKEEVRSYSSLIVEKSGLTETEVKRILELLFTSIGTVPSSLPSSALRKARAAIGNTDPDDVPYLATAITIDQAVIWSDDAVFDDQKYVPWYTTQHIIELYDDGGLDSETPS
jgi:predicted nucleic acid-binding protein